MINQTWALVGYRWFIWFVLHCVELGSTFEMHPSSGLDIGIGYWAPILWLVWILVFGIGYWAPTLWFGKSIVYFPSSDRRKRDTNSDISPETSFNIVFVFWSIMVLCVHGDGISMIFENFTSSHHHLWWYFGGINSIFGFYNFEKVSPFWWWLSEPAR